MDMTTRMRVVLRRLRQRTRRWGGRIVYIPRKIEATRALDFAPFTAWDLASSHSEKAVYFSDFCCPEKVEDFAVGLIHELGHVFAEPYGPNDSRSNEFEFLGWEIVLARQVGLSDLEFCRGNKDYGIDDDGTELREFLAKPRELAKFLAETVEKAKKAGLIKHGYPVSVRKS